MGLYLKRCNMQVHWLVTYNIRKFKRFRHEVVTDGMSASLLFSSEVPKAAAKKRSTKKLPTKKNKELPCREMASSWEWILESYNGWLRRIVPQIHHQAESGLMRYRQGSAAEGKGPQTMREEEHSPQENQTGHRCGHDNRVTQLFPIKR